MRALLTLALIFVVISPAGAVIFVKQNGQYVQLSYSNIGSVDANIYVDGIRVINTSTDLDSIFYLKNIYGQTSSGEYRSFVWAISGRYIHVPITTVPSEYAEYKIVLNGTSVSVYDSSGGLEASAVVGEFWSEVSPDGSDIRVFDQRGKLLYFWIEEWDYANQKAVIWVRLEADSTELNIAYGNPSATKSSYEDGRKVFEFFDNFNRSTISSSLTVISKSSYTCYKPIRLGDGSRYVVVSTGWFNTYATGYIYSADENYNLVTQLASTPVAVSDTYAYAYPDILPNKIIVNARSEGAKGFIGVYDVANNSWDGYAQIDDFAYVIYTQYNPYDGKFYIAGHKYNTGNYIFRTDANNLTNPANWERIDFPEWDFATYPHTEIKLAFVDNYIYILQRDQFKYYTRILRYNVDTGQFELLAEYGDGSDTPYFMSGYIASKDNIVAYTVHVPTEKYELYISTDGGNTFNKVDTFPPASGSGESHAHVFITPDNYVVVQNVRDGGTGEFRIYDPYKGKLIKKFSGGASHCTESFFYIYEADTDRIIYGGEAGEGADLKIFNNVSALAYPWTKYEEYGSIYISNGIVIFDGDAQAEGGLNAIISDVRFSPPIIASFKLKISAPQSNWAGKQVGFSDAVDVGAGTLNGGQNVIIYSQELDYGGNSTYDVVFVTKSGGTENVIVLGTDKAITDWHTMQIVWKSGEAIMVRNYDFANPVVTSTTNVPSVELPIALYVGNNAGADAIELDWVFVAKLADPADFGTPQILEF